MKLCTILSIVLISTLFSCKKGESTATTQPAKSAYAITSIEGYITKSGPLTASVTASGSLVAAEETILHSEASGRVVSINLPEGKSVAKGTLLLKVFDADIKTQIEKLKTQLKQAEITEQRLAELLKVKGVSQQEYDLAALQVQTLKSEIELQQIYIQKTELRAPYDGIIGLRKISPGAYVTPASEIASIRAASALKLDFAVPEKYSNLLHTGQMVSFTVEGNPGNHSAKIIATEQRIEAETRNLNVRALVSNSKGLLPGAFAEVNLTLGDKQHALLIPNQAIIPQARNKQVIVCRNGKAQFVTVKTGVRQANMIEITEGISAGDTVATTGVLFLRPDAPLKFSKVE
jgi:membrane fusion protein (multidrug efflux system)